MSRQTKDVLKLAIFLLLWSLLSASAGLAQRRHRSLVEPSEILTFTDFKMYALRRPLSHLIKSSHTLPFTQLYRMASTHAATIKSLDHLVLTVKSIPKTTEWYSKHLGMKAESFVSASTPGITRHSLIFGQQKINLHELGKVHPST